MSKYLKKFESFDEFDIDFAMAKIKHHFSDYDVKNMVDDEIDNWVDDSNLTEKNRNGHEYETKREWYDDHGKGAAEEVVADEISDWYEREFKKELTDDQKKELTKKLLSTYDSLQH